MTDPIEHPAIIVHYSADLWQHVCPIQRVVEPVQQSGFRLVRGNEWDEPGGELKIFPERVSEADLVVIQRDFPRHFDAYADVMERARSLGKPVLYEWDDMLTELPDSHPDYVRYMSVRAAILTAIVEADAVTCPTPYLADYTRSFNPHVSVLPNTLNEKYWKLRQIPGNICESHPIIIGYMGAHNHIPDLDLVSPVLRRLLEKYGDALRLQLWNIDPPQELASLPNVAEPWQGMVDYASFVDYFLGQSCDIVIAPLVENDFNRGKSWQKFLDYSALGVPGVYSRITPYEVVVKHGINGFLAQSPSEWEICLRKLIDDPSLRMQMGQAAQQTVRDGWMLSSHIQHWRDVYSHVASLPVESHRLVNLAARKYFAWEQETLERRDQARQEYEDALAEKDSTIQALNQVAQDQTQTIASLKQTMRHQAERIESLDNALQDQILTNRGLEQRIAGMLATAQELQARLDENAGAIAALSQQLDEKEAENQAVRGSLHETSKTLDAITSSPGWKMLQVVYGVRLVLAPRGSRRERWLHTAIKSVHALKTGSVRGFLHKVSSNLGAPPAPVAQPAVAPLLTFEVGSGKPCPDPAISLVILEGHPSLSASLTDVQEWANRQTYRGFEIILWHKAAGKASSLDSPPREWDAADEVELKQGLAGRYVCLASDELIQQSSTYVEENLLALEGEHLAFTVNTSWISNRAAQQLSQGLFPGSKTQPLQGMFVRKECVGEGFSLDLSDWLKASGNPQIVAGKLIRHITNREDDQQARIFTTTLSDGIETRLDGVYIQARRKSELPWQSQVHWLRSIETCLSLEKIPSELPTVFVIFPFLAVGGAEQLALHVISGLKDRLRFIVIATDELESSLGSLAGDFRQETPWVYNLHDFLHPALHFSFLTHLIDAFQPACLYIANGSPWIYDVLPDIKKRYPDLRTINQVYDSNVGWINRYDIPLLLALDGHIGANDKICQAYVAKGAKPDQVFLVEHGIDPEGFHPDRYTSEDKAALRQKLGLPHGKKIVTFASRIHPQKRPMDFVEMARRFSADPSVIFLMMGDGPLVGVLDEQVKKIGLKNFYRRGFYRPISDILAISDVVVLPSEYEGMPMIIAEAQLMGIPVVATDVGNNRQVLDITAGGVIIDQIGNVEALAQGVRKMLVSPPSAAGMRQAYLASFGIDVVAQKYLQALLGRSNA